MSKYAEGEEIGYLTRWMIDHMTNLDVDTLSPFEETTISGIIILFVFQMIIIVRG